jgi:RNA polymerase sigma-70 factor (ECF subfamily)
LNLFALSGYQPGSEDARVDKRIDDFASLARSAEGELRLIGHVASGSRQAFEALYRAYFPRLTRFLQRMTRNAMLIEEIVNDTLLAVWRKASTFNNTSKLSTWIFAIAYRRACKSLESLDEAVDAGEQGVDERAGLDADRPEWQFDQMRMAQAIDVALAALPLTQRTAFQLTFYHDMAYTEIAEIMDCPVNTIKTRLFHARKRLAVLLDGQLEGRP